MAYFAGYFSQHGLKFCSARTEDQAIKIFTSRANGMAPKWAQELSSAELDIALKLKPLGWGGTKEDFQNELKV